MPFLDAGYLLIYGLLLSIVVSVCVKCWMDWRYGEDRS